MTTFPLPEIKNWQEDDAKRSVKAYPLVGLSVGLLLFLVYWLTIGFSDFIQAVLVLAAWLGITGALHFDGFCDMADAVFATKSPEERQTIAKDVSVGAFAFAAGTVLLLLKVAAIISLPNALWLISIPLLARTLVLIPMQSFKVNSSSFLGESVKSNLASIRLPLVIGFGLFAVIAIASGTIGTSLSLLLLSTVFIILLAIWLTTRMDGLSGDAYGALIESSEVFMLLAVSIL